MKPASAASAIKVQAALGPRFTVLEFDAGTRTAENAAAAIGCTTAEIAKSLVFRSASGRSVLVIASGANRVDEKKVGALIGEPIGRADADFVREATGFAIGGVPRSGTRRRRSRSSTRPLMGITSMLRTKLSLKAERNWHQNSGANRRDVIKVRNITQASPRARFRRLDANPPAASSGASCPY